ncbi:flagellar protein FliT, partial [Kaarinaea lacus]
ELECERQHMISTFFIDPVEIEDSYIIREGIHKILGIDKEIIAIGKTHRQRLGDKLEQFQHSKKAVHAYKIHSN